MSTITDALNEAEPFRTAGSLPSTRTFWMVTEAIESKDVDHLVGELNHSRAHYQSLEYMLNNEAQIVETILGSFAESDDVAPTPETIEEAIRLTARVYATEVLMAAYDTAHQLRPPMALMGLNVQEALQMLYDDLDHSDPEREAKSLDNELKALLSTDDED